MVSVRGLPYEKGIEILEEHITGLENIIIGNSRAIEKSDSRSTMSMFLSAIAIILSVIAVIWGVIL